MGKQGARGKATVAGAALHRHVMRSPGAEQRNAADPPHKFILATLPGGEGTLKEEQG